MLVETSTGSRILCTLLLLFTNGGKKSSNAKRRQPKLGTYLDKLTPSNTLALTRCLPVGLVITSAVSAKTYECITPSLEISLSWYKRSSSNVLMHFRFRFRFRFWPVPLWRRSGRPSSTSRGCRSCWRTTWWGSSSQPPPVKKLDKKIQRVKNNQRLLH